VEPPPGQSHGGLRAILADRSVSAVVVTALVMMLGAGIVLPILPLFARSLGAGYGGAGILIAGWGFTRLGFDLVAGPIVDRFGPRRSAASGLAVAAAFALLTGLAPSFPVAAVCWAASGAGSAIVQTALYGQLLAVVPKQRMARTLGVFYGAFNLGLVGGGVLGGVLGQRFGLASPLFAAAALQIAAAVVYLRIGPRLSGVPRPARPGGPEVSPALRGVVRLAGIMRTPGLLPILICQLASLWLFAALFNTLVPLFGQDALGMSTVGIGAVFAVAMAGQLVVLYPAGAAADRHGRKLVLVPALAGLTAMTAAVGWAGTPVVLGALAAVLGLVSGVVGMVPGAMLSDVVGGTELGTAAGVYRFFTDLGFTFGPLTAGLVSGALGFKEAFAVTAVPGVIALLLVVRMPETLRRAGAVQRA